MKDEASADGLEILESPPFSSTDRTTLRSRRARGAVLPDVRTEYMPMLNIPAPDMDPDESRGTSADPVTPSGGTDNRVGALRGVLWARSRP